MPFDLVRSRDGPSLVAQDHDLDLLAGARAGATRVLCWVGSRRD